MITRVFGVVLPAIGMMIFSAPAYSQSAVNRESAGPASALMIRSRQSNFKVGDEIRIEVTWKNTSDKPVLAARVIPTAESKYKVYVEDDKGNLAAETTLGRRLRTGKGEQGQETVSVFETAPIRSVQPGESVSEEIILNRLYELSRPGKYTVRVQSQADQEGSSKSNTLTITVADNGNDRAK